MAQRRPAIFLLKAANNNIHAQRIIELRHNTYCRDVDQGQKVLVVKFGMSTLRRRLISIGRDPDRNDIVLPDGPSYSYAQEHCYFYYNKDKILMLRDTSGSRTDLRLEPTSEQRYRLSGSPRQRAVLRGLPYALIIGAAVFKMIWIDHDPSSANGRAYREGLAEHASQAIDTPFNNRYDYQIQVSPTVCERRTRNTPTVSYPYQGIPIIEHEKGRRCGSGAFGTVHITVDLRAGRILAVKTLQRRLENDFEHKRHLKKEVEILSQLGGNPYIAQFVHSQGWLEGAKVEIFMKAYSGNLASLIEPRHRCHDRPPPIPIYYKFLVDNVLNALDFLHHNEIVHRDLKPANILYTRSSNSWSFVVSDFGISDYLTDSPSKSGTPYFTAPEVVLSLPQSNGIDMWSFGITMLEALGYFCSREASGSEGVWRQRLAYLPGFDRHRDVEYRVVAPKNLPESWEDQPRWFSRVHALIRHQLTEHEYLIPFLEVNENRRLAARRGLEDLFPHVYISDRNSRRYTQNPHWQLR